MNFTDPVISFPGTSDCIDLKELKNLKTFKYGRFQK